MISNARFQIGTLIVDIGSHQWDFEDDTEYLERTHGTGPYGLLFRTKIGVAKRARTARFVKSDVLIDQLRQLAIAAGRSGAVVTFTPDVGEPGTTWTVHFPTQWGSDRIVDNREDVRLTLQEA